MVRPRCPSPVSYNKVRNPNFDSDERKVGLKYHYQNKPQMFKMTLGCYRTPSSMLNTEMKSWSLYITRSSTMVSASSHCLQTTALCHRKAALSSRSRPGVTSWCYSLYPPVKFSLGRAELTAGNCPKTDAPFKAKI